MGRDDMFVNPVPDPCPVEHVRTFACFIDVTDPIISHHRVSGSTDIETLQ